MMENGQQLTSRSAIPQNATTVLLIDDNAIQATTRQAILQAGRVLRHRGAESRARALEQFQHDEFPAAIGAVITDHVMPGMNGAEFVRELRKTHPELPVMVISGMEDAEAEYAGMNVRFLLKPLMPDLLLSNLRELLEQEQEGVA